MPEPLLFPSPACIPPFSEYGSLIGARVGFTGARGVLGRILGERLRRHGVLIEAYPGDIVDGGALEEWFAGRTFDLFFHFAALVPVNEVERDLTRAFEVNAIGAYRVCRQLLRGGNGWLFLASSSHVYRATPVLAAPLKVGDAEEPKSAYGRTKLAGEQLCRQLLEAHGYPHCIGRIFSFGHASQKEPYLVPTLLRRIRALGPTEPLSLDSCDSVRDIVDAETVIDAVLHLAVRRATGTVNIGSGTGLSIREIAQRMAARVGRRIAIEPGAPGATDALVADVNSLHRLLSAW